MPYRYTVPYSLLERGMRGMPHKQPEQWSLKLLQEIEDVSDIEILPFGRWYDTAESDGLSSIVLRDGLIETPETAWAAERLHQALNLPGFKSIVNPARAPLGLVQALKGADGTYPIIPPRFGLHRKNGEPRMACFLMTGTVAESFILGNGYTSQPNSSGKTRTDKRLNIQPIFGEYQRAMAYIGASLHQPCVAYEFDNACISFITRRKDPERLTAFNKAVAPPAIPLNASSTPSSLPLPLRSMTRGPQPFHLGPCDNDRLGVHAVNMDFPVALRFETTIPVFDATNPLLCFNKDREALWEDLFRLPLYHGEIPATALVTVGYTAAVDEAEGTSSPPLLSLGLQFVVIHLLHT
ncbi:hypothetical protein DFP72DRAFT_854085 [Ephemerocybe angulata]|uniref:Uncharacterized protein n=1 Tax=Ephemerocybe angulata TaxID=980116 RepID=A0A8H6HIK3_9AGAR|nr:hypothetical protein DFP72DRAFT_854085 [Tulosesus angulatus]